MLSGTGTRACHMLPGLAKDLVDGSALLRTARRVLAGSVDGCQFAIGNAGQRNHGPYFFVRKGTVRAKSFQDAGGAASVITQNFLRKGVLIDQSKSRCLGCPMMSPAWT